MFILIVIHWYLRLSCREKCGRRDLDGSYSWFQVDLFSGEDSRWCRSVSCWSQYVMLMKLTDCSGHRGRDAMMARIFELKVFVDQVREKCQNFRDLCEACAVTVLPSQNRAVLHPIIPSEALEHVQADCVSLRADSLGNTVLSNQIDCFSKFAHNTGMTYSLQRYIDSFGDDRNAASDSHEADRVIQTTKSASLPNGPYLGIHPKILQTDNGPEFKNKTYEDYCAQHGIKFVHSREYSPWVQGQVHRHYIVFILSKL